MRHVFTTTEPSNLEKIIFSSMRLSENLVSWRKNFIFIFSTEDDTFLLYVKEHEIRGVDLSYAYYNVIPSITLPFVENASAIDYDVQADRLYWTDRNRNVITSAFLNGTGIQTVIDTGDRKDIFCFKELPVCLA